MSELVERAKALAYRAHAGQVDKAGRPYIEHVARVAAAVSDDPDAEAVAWLHDTVEDTETTIADLYMDFPRSVALAVARLTSYDDETPAHYYGHICRDAIAVRVKLADIADNADEARLALLDEKTAARLRRKYAKAREALTVRDGGSDGG